MRATLSLLLLPLLLAGCGANAIDAPSLSPRAVERQPVAMPDEASEPQVPLDPALPPRIAAIEASATQGHADFEKTRARTQAAVDKAANAPSGSDAWTFAQQELSALDAARGPVNHAAAELDALQQDETNLTAGNRAAIEAAATRLNALSQTESEAVAALSGRLKP
jgi:hypothetical protein